MSLSPLEVAMDRQCDYDVVKALLKSGAVAQPDGKSYLIH